jgi:Spy/CpxP family protein refolding chaperone
MTRKGDVAMLALVLALVVGAAPLQAQRGGGFRGQAAGPHVGRSLNVLIEKQEALELTEDQLAQIQDLKARVDSEMVPLAEEIRALREQIRVGEIDRDEGYRQLQSLQGELMTASAPLRGRVQEILTVEQHRKLQAEVGLGRVGRGRVSAYRGRGGRGVPQGQLRGSRGGFRFRQGFDGQGRTTAFGFRQGRPGGPFPPANDGTRGFRRGPGWIPPVTGNEGGNLYPLR